ncbi:MAG TPA: transglutaminase-like domain-containing protein [Tepidisphaeraceae bacterium]|jgi:regulator of sirC expression with transglutaminase-like and TPR domain|nr:transglutaminase-like domain-containing protein [Tepidisphaeraceae bacterium]
MKPPIPLCCSKHAFAMMVRQSTVIHSPDALLEGALAIAAHQIPVDTGEVDRILQSYADTIRARVRGTQQQAILAHLHEYLFDELGFAGNTDDYYNPDNSYLPCVLKTKRGLPIALSLIYKIVAERVGLRCWGIGLPGHFVTAVECDGAAMLIDPFDQGRVITNDEAHDRMRQTLGDEIEWSEELLEPVSNLHWLTRILQNLLHIFGANRQYNDVAAMLELEMVLWPKQTHLQRDLALVLARIGMSQPASVWLNHYLQGNPDDPQKGDLVQLLEVLSA